MTTSQFKTPIAKPSLDAAPDTLITIQDASALNGATTLKAINVDLLDDGLIEDDTSPFYTLQRSAGCVYINGSGGHRQAAYGTHGMVRLVQSVAKQAIDPKDLTHLGEFVTSVQFVLHGHLETIKDDKLGFHTLETDNPAMNSQEIVTLRVGLSKNNNSNSGNYSVSIIRSDPRLWNDRSKSTNSVQSPLSKAQNAYLNTIENALRTLLTPVNEARLDDPDQLGYLSDEDKETIRQQNRDVKQILNGMTIWKDSKPNNNDTVNKPKVVETPPVTLEQLTA